jgi:hypothetical protein
MSATENGDPSPSESAGKPLDLGADRLGGRSDDVYAALLVAHSGLTAEESAALDARLILVLLNLVGDADTAIAAIRHARDR